MLSDALQVEKSFAHHYANVLLFHSGIKDILSVGLNG